MIHCSWSIPFRKSTHRTAELIVELCVGGVESGITQFLYSPLQLPQPLHFRPRLVTLSGQAGDVVKQFMLLNNVSPDLVHNSSFPAMLAAVTLILTPVISPGIAYRFVADCSNT